MAPRTSTFWCFLLYFVPGVYGLDEALVGAVCSGAVAAVVLLTTLIICVVLWYMSESSKRPKKKPKYDMNGNAMQNGIPLKEHARNGRPVRPIPVSQPRFVPRSYRGMPVGSYRGVPVGSFRGPPPEVLPGSYRGAPPGMVLPGTYRGAPPGIMSFSPRGPYPAMNPYFFRPVIYLDESEDDDHSMRSTVKERKKRYHRSMHGTGGRGRAPSGVIIKEVETTEEKVVDVPEDRNKQADEPGSPRRYRKSKSRSRSRSRSPDKVRNKPSSRPQSLGKSQKADLSTSYRHSYRKPDSDDEAAQIDEMFSGFSAVPKEGDIVFQKAEPKSETIRPITPPRTPPRTPSPVLDEPPLISNYQYASVIRQSEPEPDRQPFSEEIQQREMVIETDVYSSVIKSTEPVDTNLYSSVIRKDNHDRGNPLRQSMAERLEEIVQNRHEGRPTEFDENRPDEDTYPVKTHSLSHTQRSEIAASRREGTSNFLSQSRRRSDGSEEYRPETPPDDYPMISPRESFVRSEAPASTRVPEIDLGASPRPATPPFDVTDRSEKPAPPRVVAEPNTKQDFKGAFSDQVLQELKRRQQSTSNDDDDDDDDDRNGRAVNFSAQPPEIIPRSEPNSPRTSMNIPQDIPPPPPVITPGVIPPAPPPPPPPPPPPVPK